MENILSTIIKFFTASLQLEDVKKELIYQKAWAAYWQIFSGINLAVYFKNSIGRESTYCNITVYDLLDSLCTAVWEVVVQVGASEKWSYPMGQTIRAFDFDITPIMPNGNYNNILNAPIPEVQKLALNAAKNGVIRKLEWGESQELANLGIPSIIISAKIKHVAITAPNFQWDDTLKEWELLPYDIDKGPFTGNAGSTNGMMYMTDRQGFGAYNWRDDAFVFELRDRKSGEFLSNKV